MCDIVTHPPPRVKRRPRSLALFLFLDLLLGAAYGFHVTLTWHVLKSEQSDISDQGYLFSAVVIFLGNVAVLLTGIPLLAAKVDVVTALQWWGESTYAAVRWLARLGQIGS